VTAVLEEERRWELVVEGVLGPDATILSVSRWLPDSRAYAAGGKVAIIRSASAGGANDLRRSEHALRRIGRSAEHRSFEGFEALVTDRVEGRTLESLLPSLGLRSRLDVLVQVVRALGGLHGRGVAHRDLRPDNVVITGNGDVELVDFDRSVATSVWNAWLADFIGLSRAGFSENPFWSLALFTLLPKSRSFGRRLRSAIRGSRREVSELAAAENVPADIRLLARAWSEGQRTLANAPGQGVAYYALTYRGFHFPGERPWYLRWEPIRHAVRFDGKRVLELGCNLALLSSFASLHGASHVTAVDRHEDVLEGARQVAEALGASVTFKRLDLASPHAWEEELADFDVVTALSLVHWLPDPDRVLRFLGRHREAIYEGHDPPEVEVERLRRAGFYVIERIAETERGRPVFYARQ
jgi:hypothetical protein